MITLDASVAVKWFKDGEEDGDKALALLGSIKDMEVSCTASEWLVLEVVRALVKAGYVKGKIEGAYQALEEFFHLGVIRCVPVSWILGLSKDLEVSHGLYAADAVHLATAIHTSSEILLTEDRHLLAKNVRNYSKKHGVKVLSLKEYYHRA
jgi:predicted nucleic acid-binding protein